MNNLAIIRFKPPSYNHFDEGANRVGKLNSLNATKGWLGVGRRADISALEKINSYEELSDESRTALTKIRLRNKDM